MRQAVASGCDVITASGDKLMGGPQAGILIGKNDPIDQIAKHPLARALRVDKLTLTALEATLRLYRDPEHAKREIPTLRYLGRRQEELQCLAQELENAIGQACGSAVTVTHVMEQSQVGGGSLPGQDGRQRAGVNASIGLSVDQVGAALRMNRPPIFCRIKDDAILLDPRTLEEPELYTIAEALKHITTK